MPALSPTMTQGNIGAWKKSVGDLVSPGDVLVEIETDKAQMDFECQEEGYLAKILMPEGVKEASVGKPLAILVDNKEDIAKFESYQAEEGGTGEPKKQEAKVEKKSSTATEASLPSPPSKPPAVDASTQRATDKVLASPLARNTAKSLGVDLHGISGSGPGGRIVKNDVLSAAPDASATAASSTFTDLPLSNMRRVIAQRLSESKQTIPHYYLTVDINMDNLLQVREKLNQRGTGKFKISVNDFLIKAAARAMVDVPEVNSAWHGTFIRQHRRADISVAVATEAGLITPIVTGADLKGLAAISEEMRELATKARANKLRPEQYQGGTFTISNLGMFGVKHFTAIINPPQACILAVGGTERRFVPDKDGNPVAAAVMTVTMSCDHRVVDGAMGAQWLKSFRGYLEDPITIIL